MGVAFDAGGNLYVSDTGNSRVLAYHASLGGTGDVDQLAERVFGKEGKFDSYLIPPLGPDSLFGPTSVAVDPAGDLYVADSYNSRVLESNFPLQATATKGSHDTKGDAVFGQMAASLSAYAREPTSTAIPTQSGPMTCAFPAAWRQIPRETYISPILLTIGSSGSTNQYRRRPLFATR